MGRRRIPVLSRLAVAPIVASRPCRKAPRSESCPTTATFRVPIDSVGRPPTRDELAAYQAPGFDLDARLDAQLASPSHAERIRRIDQARCASRLGRRPVRARPLELRRQRVTVPTAEPSTSTFAAASAASIRHRWRLLPDPGRDRPAVPGQRRADRHRAGGRRSARRPDGRGQAVVAVRRRAAIHADNLVAPDWARGSPGSRSRRSCSSRWKSDVRVCREEAQTADTGAVYASGGRRRKGRAAARRPADAAAGRQRVRERDKGRAVSCGTGVGFATRSSAGAGSASSAACRARASGTRPRRS